MSSTEPLQLGLLGQIGMTVTDVDRSIPFYRDVLGIPFLFGFPNLAFFDCGGVRLMLSPASGEGEGKKFSSILYFRVPDIQAAHQQIADRGATFVQGPHLVAKMPDHDLWMAFLEDPDGNTLALMSEVRKG
ncbi:MAG: VOC family protein [Bryobacteraceae bacterium]